MSERNSRVREWAKLLGDDVPEEFANDCDDEEWTEFFRRSAR